MLTEFDQLINTLPLILLMALVYWSGKWYSEWFFDSFEVQYASLDFSRIHYFFASWNTILTGICILFVAVFFYLSLFIFPSLLFKAISVLCVITVILIFSKRWPFEFDTNDGFVRKVLGAKEFSIQAVGIFSFLMAMIGLFIYVQEVSFQLSMLLRLLQSYWVLLSILFLIGLWIYIGIIGYWLGRYHAQSAISYGRMGVKWANVENEWLLLIVRTQDKRNLVYDVEKKDSRFVLDELINKTTAFNRLPNKKDNELHGNA